MSMYDLVDEVVAAVGKWDGVTVNPHRFGGQEFNLEKVEIGHIHRNGMVDIPFTRKIRDILVADGRAEHHHILPDSGWISYYIRGEDDMENAVWLYRLSLLQKQLGRARHDPQRAEQIEGELRSLNLSSALAEAFGLSPEKGM